MVNFFQKPHFSKENDARIVSAIRAAEAGTSGEIRVHLVKKCGQDPLAEARKVFDRLRMRRTKLRNGVLILVCLQTHRFAIYGDQGIHEKVRDDFWITARDTMLGYFKQHQEVDAIVAGVKQVGEKLREFFPAQGKNPNELSDTITGS